MRALIVLSAALSLGVAHAAAGAPSSQAGQAGRAAKVEPDTSLQCNPPARLCATPVGPHCYDPARQTCVTPPGWVCAAGQTRVCPRPDGRTYDCVPAGQVCGN